MIFEDFEALAIQALQPEAIIRNQEGAFYASCREEDADNQPTFESHHTVLHVKGLHVHVRENVAEYEDWNGDTRYARYQTVVLAKPGKDHPIDDRYIDTVFYVRQIADEVVAAEVKCLDRIVEAYL